MKKYLFSLFILCVTSCSNGITWYIPPQYHGCHGFSQNEYTFTVKEDTKSVSIEAWRKLNAEDDKEIMAIVYDTRLSTAIKGKHFKCDSTFQAKFVGSKTTSNVEIELIPKNIVEPVVLILRYFDPHYDDEGYTKATEITINLVPSTN